MEKVELGQIISIRHKRDAVHVAVLPMLAVREMKPGEHLKEGIVDPFLPGPVMPGQWFYLCLYPNSVTSLRHVWSHPRIAEEAK